MVVENLRIDVTPGGVPLVIHVSQNDAGLRQFVFTPYDKGVAMAKIAGATVTMEATKPDGYAVQHPCTYNNDGTITYTLQEQLAAVEGQVWSKLTWRDSNGNILGAKAIVWAVDRAGIEDGAIVSDSDLPLIEQAAEFASEYEEKVADMIAEMQIVPGQVVIDGTLTVPGAAADSKVVGTRFIQAEMQLWTSDIKTTLLACFQNVAWINDQGQTYYDALQTALYANEYPKLSAVYSGQTVFSIDTLDTVKQFLTVTYYADSESAGVVVPSADYNLTGTLQVGRSTLVASYSGARAAVIIPNVVDFYNNWVWRMTDGAFTKLEGSLDRNAQAESGTYISLAETRPSVVYRRTMCERVGILQYTDYISHLPSGWYPIPVPPGANKITFSVTLNTQFSFLNLLHYNSNTGKYEAASANIGGWTQGDNIKTFTAGSDLFIAANMKYDSAGTTYPTEPAEVVITFEEV